MTVIGLDIGGANLKAADGSGAATTVPFPLWKQPDQLAAGIEQLLAQLPPADLLAVTMTGELADCYPDRATGVCAILDAVEQAAAGRPVYVWQTAGEFVSGDVGRAFPMLTSAANWHALATWAGRIVTEGCGLLLDIGSTTSDIILLRDGHPEPVGLTDYERLQSGELVYTGARRTPVCAVAAAVPLAKRLPLAAELFATMLDVYLIDGRIPENHFDCDTADGRSATRASALTRLRRALCADEAEVSEAELCRAAEWLMVAQREQLSQAVSSVLDSASEDIDVQQVLISGSGSFLATEIVRHHPLLSGAEVLRLDTVAGPEVSTAACAYALAQLAMERC